MHRTRQPQTPVRQTAPAATFAPASALTAAPAANQQSINLSPTQPRPLTPGLRFNIRIRTNLSLHLRPVFLLILLILTALFITLLNTKNICFIGTDNLVH